ncbi:unnamed protein product [Larinioides sclopetarius]|uniref:Uncharacterized protein n=1 Tax=Larinioides sclopetarius TaxID=280406 RepID=A0AAV2BZS8_9ARAC
MEETKICISNGADLYGRDHNSQSSLHLAAKGPYLDLVKYVLKFNSCVNIQDDNGQTTLHVAALKGRVITVEYFFTIYENGNWNQRCQWNDTSSCCS